MKIVSSIKKLFKPSKYSIKVFIDNLGFENRGDQLMIQSVMEQVRLHLPKAQLLVREHVFSQNQSYCIQNHLYPLQLKNTGLRCSKFYSWLVNTLLRDEWINSPRDVDVILDCRGYHITDHFIKDDDYVGFLANFYSLFNKKGRKLFMLPQAFGPFNNEASKAAIQIIFKQAAKIYAREQQSYNYLCSVLPKSNKIQIVPDFTCLCPAESAPSIQLPKNQYVLVIPNSRMLDKTDSNISNSYLQFLYEIVDYLVKEGEEVALLNHEGIDDEKLLYNINEKIDGRLPIFTNLTGTEIKAIIRDCKLLISARYHGVVSGLTQGVPTLCSSWSHKYAELLKEHGCDDNVLDVADIESSVGKIKDALANPTMYSSKDGCEKIVEEKVNNMWMEVFEAI